MSRYAEKLSVGGNYRPKKSLGQHFLTSTSVLKKIIDAADVKQGETILEIGPGTGILTQALWEEILTDQNSKLIAIEKDHDMVTLLRKKFEDELEYDSKLNVIRGDILREHPSPLDAIKPPLENGAFALIANIPYYITGLILEKFLEHGPRPNRMVLLVQKEVAERIVARDGKESVLSISVKAFGTPRIVDRVPRGAFSPPPAVDSAILAIDTISDKLFREKNIDTDHFFKIVKAGFIHKRKFLIRNLEAVLGKEKIERAWAELKLDPKIRAEDITTDMWVKIVSATA